MRSKAYHRAYGYGPTGLTRITQWQWRARYGNTHPEAGWRLHGDGEKPDIWWMQMEYRERPTPGIVWC